MKFTVYENKVSQFPYYMLKLVLKIINMSLQNEKETQMSWVWILGSIVQ